MSKKLDKIFNESKRMIIDDETKIVIMSDCHRGAGDNFDNFVKNRNIYEAALRHYYSKGFTYVELGDGDEMLEVLDYKDIVEVYLDVFRELKKFYDDGRLIMIYGNHDIEKKIPAVLEENFYKYYDKITKKYEPLLDGLVVYESLVLKYQNYDIFLIHGHQVDFISGKLGRISNFLIRYIWKNLELIGVKDPTGAAKNYEVTSGVEKRLKKWSIKNNKIIIAGHTHRAIFPKVGTSLYFNDGSCIHTNGITCIEIEKGNIALVKWEFRVNDGEVVSVVRKVLASPVAIVSFFEKN